MKHLTDINIIQLLNFEKTYPSFSSKWRDIIMKKEIKKEILEIIDVDKKFEFDIKKDISFNTKELNKIKNNQGEEMNKLQVSKLLGKLNIVEEDGKSFITNDTTLKVEYNDFREEVKSLLKVEDEEAAKIIAGFLNQSNINLKQKPEKKKVRVKKPKTFGKNKKK